jgi:hypothetical protein
MDPFSALSTAAAARKIPPLKEASPAKVMSCALVASSDIEKDLDATEEVIGKAGAPSAKMVGQPANSSGRPTMVCGHLAHREEGWPSLACQDSLYTRGCGTCPTRALSPRLTIGKEHRSVMPTRPTTGTLTPRKVTIRHQLMVPLSSSDDDLSLVKHDAQVDLNPDDARSHYTQDLALMSDLPPLIPRVLHCVGAAGWSRAWQGVDS